MEVTLTRRKREVKEGIGGKPKRKEKWLVGDSNEVAVIYKAQQELLDLKKQQL